MKRIICLISMSLLIFAVILVSGIVVLADGDADKSVKVQQSEQTNGGLVKEGDKLRYYDKNGKTKSGWLAIGSKRYYLDSNGYAVKGWKQIKNSKGTAYRYYFDENSVMCVGWKWIKNSKGTPYRYFFAENGVMYTNWKDITNSKGNTYRYYFGDNGAMRTSWKNITNSKGNTYRFFFGDNGAMRTGWQWIENSRGVKHRYYFASNGVMYTNWKNITNSKGNTYRYYFGDNGAMRTGWRDITNSKGNTYRYYFGENGAMRKGFVEGNGKTYYFRENGVFYCGWKTSDEVFSRKQITLVESEYGIKKDSRQFFALLKINQNYSDRLSSSSKDGTLLFLMEGAGRTDDITVRKCALGVLVRNRKIIYLNINCSTIPDCPFDPSRNYGDPMPTLKSGIYNFTTTYHSSATTQCAGLNVNSAKVVRHRNQTDYYSSTSSSINIHRRNRNFVAKSADEQISSAGCIVIGNSGKSSTDEYANYSAILGITDPGDSGTASVKHNVSGKVIVDRSFAKKYLRAIGYTDGAIALIG